MILSLFYAPEGFYRFIAFVVTDQAYVTREETLPEAEALRRLRRGASALPIAYQSKPFSNRHRIDALIYEFRKESEDDEVKTLKRGLVPADMHLRNSGLEAALIVAQNNFVTSTPRELVEVADITIQLVAPTQYEDGTPLNDLAGYKIYYGYESGNYRTSVRIDNPGLTIYVVENLTPNTYCFVFTVFNIRGVESQFSNEVCKLLL